MSAGRRRPPVVWPVVILVLGLVVAGVVWVAAPFGGDTLAPGDTRVLEAPAWGRSATVVTPAAEVDLLVGAPVERVDGQLREGFERDEDLVAERGDRLVVVSWASRVTSISTTTQVPPTVDAQPVTLTLRAGGEEFDLDTTTDEGTLAGWQHQVFAVSGTPAADDVTIDVTYDGITQTVRGTGEVDRGPAAGLTSPTRLTVAGDCILVGSASLDTVAMPCAIGPVTLLPYVGGQGWVEAEDEVFALVPVDLGYGPSLGDGRPPEGYDTYVGAVTATLDGQLTVDAPAETDATYSGVLVFRVDGRPKELEITREVRLSPEVPGSALPERRATLSARVVLS